MSLRLDRSADQSGAAAEDRHGVLGCFVRSGSSSRSFATRHCCHSAFSCIASSFVLFCGELRFDHAGEREIHVVAAEQDVFADRDALELSARRLPR